MAFIKADFHEAHHHVINFVGIPVPIYFSKSEENAANLGNVLRPEVKYVFQCVNFFSNKNCSTGLREDLFQTSLVSVKKYVKYSQKFIYAL